MYPPRIWIEYRPVRIGLVIADPDTALFAEAVRLTHCLWGGTYNPIIPAYHPALARSLCKLFNVDLLFGIGPEDKTKPLIDEFPHLPPGMWGNAIFNEDSCRFVDVYHPMRKLSERIASMSEQERAEGGFVWPTWQDDDPLANVFLATVGSYPDEARKFDYRENYKRALKASEIALAPNTPVDVNAWRLGNPTSLARHKITRKTPNYISSHGILVGSAAEIEDLILFWNLSAAGKSVEFYDKDHASRLRPWLDEFIGGRSEVTQLSSDHDRIDFTIWSRSEHPEHDLDLKGLDEVRSVERSAMWNGLNIKPTTVWFSSNHIDAIPTLYDLQDRTHITFPLPNQPFYDDDPFLRRQNFVSSVSFSTYGEDGDQWSLSTPFIPSLNQFYSRNLTLRYAESRSERHYLLGAGALGIVTAVGNQQKTVYPYRVLDFLAALFMLADIEIERSDKGLICARLVQQLGGLQGCRVFKIRGVRSLIQKYGPSQSFTRGGAETLIGNIIPPENRFDFSDYEDLFIEQREHRRLTPKDAFEYLLKKGVFRAGLELTCPECNLTGWTHIDELHTKTTCQFCGTKFDISAQLKDRDWRYRRSGLFGVEDHQGGSIPVALTLQQLHTSLDDRFLMHATSMNFQSKANAFKNCEADFLVLVAGREGYQERPLQVLIGECKSEGGRIDEDDIKKLGDLADAMPEELAQTFIMFSKTGTFDADELTLIKSLNNPRRPRVIVWSKDELEPYHPYIKHEARLGNHAYASSLVDMVLVTERLFFA